VVVPNYALCPAVSVEHIALQMAAAVAWVWRHAAEFGGNPGASPWPGIRPAGTWRPCC
jgi:acetyl esterase/lipase